ncbi:MAG: cytochrome b/b6 domain-containing protein [Sphingomonadaceae bacterium]
MSKNKQRVWDWPVRLLHWSLVGCITAAWLTRSQTGPAHEYFGYGAAAIVSLRVLWGWLGNSYARFTQFVRGGGATLAYLRLVLQGRAPRYLGHNPLGGWMVLGLLSCVALLGVTGWSLGTELLWGYAWPVNIHVTLGWLLLCMVALHLSGVIFTSWQHRENLVAAMLTGDKPKD